MANEKNTEKMKALDAVLLQIVAFAGDVRGNLDSVGQTHTGNLTKSRVRFFRGRNFDHGAHTAFLRRVLVNGGTLFGVPAFEQSGGLSLFLQVFSSLANQLIKGRQ